MSNFNHISVKQVFDLNDAEIKHQIEIGLDAASNNFSEDIEGYEKYTKEQDPRAINLDS